MPRPERSLDPSAGPVQRLAADLRQLRQQAGNPPYRTLARICGYSVTSLSDAAGGRRLPALPVLRAYVEACGGEPAAWESRWRAVSAELALSRCDEAEQPPYPGLASFQPDDRERFFGRERLVAELARRMADGGFHAIVGASGSGKSSLLRAGLVPVLAGSDPYVLITPGPHPMDGFDPSGPLVLVDQFEEVFTLCRDDAERARFVDALLDAAARPGVLVVIALRSDFYGRCAQYPRLVEALRDATALIGPMSEEELARAVTGPAGLAGLSVERALVTKVISDAGGRPGALPMVSHAMLETWRQRQGRTLTLAGYEAAGGVTGAVGRTAEQVYEGFDQNEREVVRHVLTRLTTLGEGTEDVRRRVDRAELDIDGAAAVIDTLARARLLHVDEHTVEVSHEALIAAWPRLRDWLTEDRDALRVHRQLTEAAAIWQDLDRDAGALYRGARLATAREWAADHGRLRALTRLERDFFDASVGVETAERAAAERRSRQFRVLSAALAVLLVVAVAGAGLAAWQWREAVGQRQQALSRQLAAQALAAARTDVAGALRLGVDAYRAAPTVEARGAVLSLASHQGYSSRLLPRGRLVKDVAFSPDGAVLAAATQDGRVSLWDVARRTQRAVLVGHESAVRAVAYQPGGALLASGGLDGEVIIWDLARAVSMTRLHGHRGAVDGVAFSPDGAVLASIGEDHRIVLWRVADGSLLGELAGHGGKISAIAFRPDGRTLVSAGDDGTAVLWDVARRTRIRHFGGGPPLYAVAVSPDGKLVATAGEQHDISIWDAATGRHVASLVGHTEAVYALAFTRDGATLVSAGFDQVASVWDVRRGGRVAILTGHTSELYGIAVSPDGRTIASASRDETILLWDRRRMPFVGQLAEIGYLTVSDDGRTLAATATDGTGMLWDTGSREVRAVRRTREPLAKARLVHSGQLVITRAEDVILLWDAATGEPVRQFRAHSDRLVTTDLNADAHLLALGAADRTVHVWDTRTGDSLAVLDQPAVPQQMFFTADGRTLFAICRDGTVTAWDTVDRTARTALRLGIQVSGAALSADGGRLAVGGPRGEVMLWDLRRGERIGVLTGHTAPVTALAFSPDGRLLASGGQDGTLRLWEVSGQRLWATLVGHATGISAAVWSPAGDVLYTGGVDRGVIPWIVDFDDAMAGICRDLLTPTPNRPPGGCASDA